MGMDAFRASQLSVALVHFTAAADLMPLRSAVSLLQIPANCRPARCSTQNEAPGVTATESGDRIQRHRRFCPKHMPDHGVEMTGRCIACQQVGGEARLQQAITQDSLGKAAEAKV